MVGLPHQLQHRWCGGGNGDDDGVGDGVGDGGGDDGAPSTQCEQPGCGVAWPPPHCRLAGEPAGDAGPYTKCMVVIHSPARWRCYCTRAGSYTLPH